MTIDASLDRNLGRRVEYDARYSDFSSPVNLVDYNPTSINRRASPALPADRLGALAAIVNLDRLCQQFQRRAYIPSAHRQFSAIVADSSTSSTCNLQLHLSSSIGVSSTANLLRVLYTDPSDLSPEPASFLLARGYDRDSLSEQIDRKTCFKKKYRIYFSSVQV